MKMVAMVTFLAAALMTQEAYRCPCQETKKSGKDERLACADSLFPCDCDCERIDV